MITRLYCDGGVIGPNPSPLGGTWAWCGTDEEGSLLAEGAGIVSPEDVGRERVTNNLAELLAAVRALSALAGQAGEERPARQRMERPLRPDLRGIGRKIPSCGEGREAVN